MSDDIHLLRSLLLFTYSCAVAVGEQSFGLAGHNEYLLEASCTIPEQMQGTYNIQDNEHPPQVISPGIRGPVQYQELFVGPTAIPRWGDCYERMGHNFVLGYRKVGGAMCYRCLMIVQRSPNVVQVQMQDEKTCYPTVNEAKTTCLDPGYVTPGDGLMLWRVESELVYEQCPLGGRANLTYSVLQQQMCSFPAYPPSSISSCEVGYQLDIRFRSCNFPDYDMNLRCLGTWDTGRGNGEMFFAVYNAQVQEYRCGIIRSYHEQQTYTMAALSNDSTCTNMLANSTFGHDSFVLYQDPKPTWPPLSTACTFPAWMHGDWEVMTVQADLLSFYQYHDPSTMNTVYAKCVSINADGERMRLLTRNHCGDIMGYQCLWLRRRAPWVIEIKMGAVVSPEDRESLCDDHAFANVSWITLAGRGADTFVNCPHLAHFTTRIPSRERDGPYCFNLTANCLLPHTVKYQSYVCDTDEVFDVRLYKCMATWTENGYHYTYVQRNDGSRRCFVSVEDGLMLRLLWTGDLCERAVRLPEFAISANSTEPVALTFRAEGACPPSNDERSTVPSWNKTPPITSAATVDPLLNLFHASGQPPTHTAPQHFWSSVTHLIAVCFLVWIYI